MLSYNILNDFVEKLKSGNVTPDDLVKVGNAVKDADLQVKYEVENIKAIPSDILNEVKCGDVIAKKTGEQYHCYIVTYKQENHGICLTYFDASVLETQSYDYVTDAWVYNSEDKTGIIYTGGTGINVTNGQISADTAVLQEKLTAGDNITIEDGVISAITGSAIFRHELELALKDLGNMIARIYIEIYSSKSTAYTLSDLLELFTTKEICEGFVLDSANSKVGFAYEIETKTNNNGFNVYYYYSDNVNPQTYTSRDGATYNTVYDNVIAL